jgi:hypothetical protein
MLGRIVKRDQRVGGAIEGHATEINPGLAVGTKEARRVLRACSKTELESTVFRQATVSSCRERLDIEAL